MCGKNQLNTENLCKLLLKLVVRKKKNRCSQEKGIHRLNI